MFLVDTNLLSEMRRYAAGRANPVVAQWLDRQVPEALFISALVLFESEIGILRLERRDPQQGAILRAWMTTAVLPLFDGRTLPLDGRVARLAASYHVPDPASVPDSLIAATAVVHGLTVATRNFADFRFPGVAVINPWDSG